MNSVLVVVAIVTAAYSHYWPPYGGINGGKYVATGELASSWQNHGVACPPDWEFGTTVMFADSLWECVDRGGMVTYTRDGRPILDFMEQRARYGHKSAVRVYIVEEMEMLHEFY